MELYVDLHIHSCLSPCADDDMTPNNIVGMAKLKGLDAIAVTDHNAYQNLPAVQEVAQRHGIVLLPGMEVTTREEVHVLCYFECVESAAAFGAALQGLLPPIPNNPSFFGNQIVLNEEDEEIGRLEPLLIQGTDIGIDQLLPMVMEGGGVCVPAHINKSSNSIISNLGFLPLDQPYAAVEVMRSAALDADTGRYRVLHSSDAHTLGAILEKEFVFEAEERSAKGILNRLRSFIG